MIAASFLSSAFRSAFNPAIKSSAIRSTFLDSAFAAHHIARASFDFDGVRSEFLGKLFIVRSLFPCELQLNVVPLGIELLLLFLHLGNRVARLGRCGKVLFCCRGIRQERREICQSCERIRRESLTTGTGTPSRPAILSSKNSLFVCAFIFRLLAP